MPKHYVARDTIRLLRNAVIHGGELPTKNNADFRAHFDKWRLFLFRRVLVRLRYTGHVVSPERGWKSSSPVNDFSEEHNSFSAVADTDAVAGAFKKLRNASSGA